MVLVYDPIILPFILSMLITFWLVLYAIRRPVPGARVFAILMALLTLWTFCYTMELASVQLDAKILWLKLKYLGAAPGPAGWFIFSLYLTDKRHWLRKGLGVLLAGLVATTLAIIFS